MTNPKYAAVSGDAPTDAADRRSELQRLDEGLSAAGSKYLPGYAQRMVDLGSATCAFVDGLRESGLGPAEVLIRLKARIAACHKSSTEVDAFVVSRAIARYFEDTSLDEPG